MKILLDSFYFSCHTLKLKKLKPNELTLYLILSVKASTDHTKKTN